MTHARTLQLKKPHPAVVAAAGDWEAFHRVDSPVVTAAPAPIVVALHGVRGLHYAVTSPLWSIGQIAPVATAPVPEDPPSIPERLPGLDRLVRAARAFPNLDFNIDAFFEAVVLLDIIQTAGLGLPTPDVGIGEKESAISWTKGDLMVLISLEGDGEAAYACHVDGRFEPGKEPFPIADRRLPNDLRDYLVGMYS